MAWRGRRPSGRGVEAAELGRRSGTAAEQEARWARRQRRGVDQENACDLKPSNVLLDLEMTAYVGDFGLAKFMCASSTAASANSTSLANLKGSIGYIAPGYRNYQPILFPWHNLPVSLPS